MIRICLVAGARPNYIKVAALWKAYKKLRARRPRPPVSLHIVHTGQHYDYLMCRKHFRDLNLPTPAVDLGVGSATHAVQTARIMQRFEKVLLRDRPDLVMVVGDVNSTLACSLVAAKMEIPVAHVEAGLRSYDRTMPEEINRLVTDALSDYLFTSCRDGDHNLIREGHDRKRIFFVGNVMVDTLLSWLPKANVSSIGKKLGLEKPYALLTLHRPSNVDKGSELSQIVRDLAEIQKNIPVVFPVHPRTAARMKKGSVLREIRDLTDFHMVPPLGYLDFISLMKGARFVMTDSGGIQEETTVLGVPCLTLRPNTERPVTITQGTNTLVGRNGDLVGLVRRILNRKPLKKHRIPPLWDGKSADRIFAVLSRKVGF